MSDSTRRQELVDLLGDRPPWDRPIRVVSRTIEERPAYRLERLVLDLNGQQNVPACLAIPHGVVKPPVVLYNHSHGGHYSVGKAELLNGQTYLASPYADELTKQGFAILAIDHWCFGERNNQSEADTFKAMLWDGRVLWGMMLYDSQRAIDYLFSRQDLDATRLATIGMSMGGTHAIWISAIDKRIQLCIDLCGNADFQSLIASKGLHQHGLYYYVPRLLKHFTAAQIQSLIAPRPRWSLVGARDSLTPGTDLIDIELKRVYAELNAADLWHYHAFDCGHEELPETRQRVIEALQALK